MAAVNADTCLGVSIEYALTFHDMQHHNTKQIPEQPREGSVFCLHYIAGVQCSCSISLAGKHAPMWLFVAFLFRTTEILSGKTGLVLLHGCSKATIATKSTLDARFTHCRQMNRTSDAHHTVHSCGSPD